MVAAYYSRQQAEEHPRSNHQRRLVVGEERIIHCNTGRLSMRIAGDCATCR